MNLVVNISNETDFMVNEQAVDNLVRAVLEDEKAHGSLTVAFVGEQTIADLNERYRSVPEPTDVLSFAYVDDEGVEDWLEPEDPEEGFYLGDILICPAVAEVNAAEDDIAPAVEVGRLVLHGVLHLLRYDHETDEGQMAAREAELREELRSILPALFADD